MGDPDQDLWPHMTPFGNFCIAILTAMEHDHFLKGKSSVNGPSIAYGIAMLVYWRVSGSNKSGDYIWQSLASLITL